MFSLDHGRLRRGGQEILEAKGDVGEALFSAGSGFQDLRRQRRLLDENAERLWSKRRSAKRAYYQADDRLKDAEGVLRAHTVSANAWRELKGRFESSQKTHREIGGRLEAREAELRKVGRIRRLARFVHDKIRLGKEIERLGDIPEIPPWGQGHAAEGRA